MRLFSAFLVLMLLASGTTMAACSNPAGDAGHVIFNTTVKTMQYCNGTDWINAGAVIANAPQTGCISLTGAAGGTNAGAGGTGGAGGAFGAAGSPGGAGTAGNASAGLAGSAGGAAGAAITGSGYVLTNTGTVLGSY